MDELNIMQSAVRETFRGPSTRLHSSGSAILASDGGDLSCGAAAYRLQGRASRAASVVMTNACIRGDE